MIKKGEIVTYVLVALVLLLPVTAVQWAEDTGLDYQSEATRSELDSMEVVDSSIVDGVTYYSVVLGEALAQWDDGTEP